MQLTWKVKDIPESGLHLDLSLPAPMLADALAGVGGDVAASRASAHLDVHATGDNVRIGGQLEGELAVPCARCLGEARVSLAIPLRAIVAPESIGGEDSLDEEIEYFTHDGETLHLEPVLRETLILSLPMTALCREGCLGLCAVCGCDRNQKDCGCEPGPDPRLAVLKDFKP